MSLINDDIINYKEITGFYDVFFTAVIDRKVFCSLNEFVKMDHSIHSNMFQYLDNAKIEIEKMLFNSNTNSELFQKKIEKDFEKISTNVNEVISIYNLMDSNNVGLLNEFNDYMMFFDSLKSWYFESFNDQNNNKAEIKNIIDPLKAFNCFIDRCKTVLSNAQLGMKKVNPKSTTRTVELSEKEKEEFEKFIKINTDRKRKIYQIWSDIHPELFQYAGRSKTLIEEEVFVKQNEKIVKHLDRKLDDLCSVMEKFRVDYYLNHCRILPKNQWFYNLSKCIYEYKSWFEDKIKLTNKIPDKIQENHGKTPIIERKKEVLPPHIIREKSTNEIKNHIDHPFSIKENLELFKYFHEWFKPSGQKVKYTYIFDFFREIKKETFSQSKFFRYASCYSGLKLGERKQSDRSIDYSEKLSQLEKDFKELKKTLNV